MPAITIAEYRALKKPKKARSGNYRDRHLDRVRASLKFEGIAFVDEYRFHDTRRWLFDIALPEYKIAIEYEGITGGKSRHTTVTGYTGDCDKYNEGQMLGWIILRFTAKNVKGAHAVVMRAIDKRNNQNQIR